MNLISTAPISPDTIEPGATSPVDRALAALAAAGIGFEVIGSGAGQGTADFDVAA